MHLLCWHVSSRDTFSDSVTNLPSAAMFPKLHLTSSQPPSAKLEINLFALLPVWVWSMKGYYIYQAITTITSQCNGCWHITIHHPHPGNNDVSNVKSKREYLLQQYEYNGLVIGEGYMALFYIFEMDESG